VRATLFFIGLALATVVAVGLALWAADHSKFHHGMRGGKNPTGPLVTGSPK
jgi:hypothetical protein